MLHKQFIPLLLQMHQGHHVAGEVSHIIDILSGLAVSDDTFEDRRVDTADKGLHFLEIRMCTVRNDLYQK